MAVSIQASNQSNVRSSTSQADRYKWAKLGDKGQKRNIDLSVLKIDYDYQRKEISDRNTLGIARDFNWAAFNTIVVMERANGDLYVVDGQQRVLAAKRRGDIASVPAIVFFVQWPCSRGGGI